MDSTSTPAVQSSRLKREVQSLLYPDLCQWLASFERPKTPKVQQRSKGLGGETQRTEVFVLSTNYLGFHAGPDDFYIHFGG